VKPQNVLPIKVALFGMDTRASKTLALYLKGPCKGIAEVVTETEAEVDIIDADFATAGEILQQRRQVSPRRPIVLLSLQSINIENTYFLQKPIKSDNLVAILNKVRGNGNSTADQPQAQLKTEVAPNPPIDHPQTEDNPETETESVQNQPARAHKKSLVTENEGGYTAFLGLLADIDFDDPTQAYKARFNPNHYLLGQVLSARQLAYQQDQAILVNSVWKPLTIYPDTHQIEVDAQDKQLRIIAGMEQSQLFSDKNTLTPVNLRNISTKNKPEAAQNLEAFIWKLTVWTSKGRYLNGLDPNHPVHLEHWPNFTRLLLVPDAMRISALLIREDQSPNQIIHALNIKPQYVFAFLSACHSIGLLKQGEKLPEQATQTLTPPTTIKKKQSLLGKILNKLRGEQ